MNNCKLKLKLCYSSDLDKLAEMNKQLIEDEQHDNSMNLVQLTERMKSFIENDYRAYFFTVEYEIVGYILINMLSNPIYLRQLFICREHRRKSYGKTAFEAVLQELNTQSIDLEVLSWNKIAQAFWNSIGFKERSIYMRYNKES